MAMDHTVSLAQETASGSIDNAQTVTIGSKVYTFQATLTDVDGNVKLGADDAESYANLAAAIELGAGAGTAYAASMTRHPSVEVLSVGATPDITVGAPGEGANQISLAETGTGTIAWGGATLSGGAGNVAFWSQRLAALNQLNSEVYDEVAELSPNLG